MSSLRRYLPFFTIAISVIALYLYKLDGVGVLSTDEPRYAAIGQSMAATGDYVTPRLWGSPWFEKPPLLYWMTAAAVKLGANAELAGRLPVAILSLLFLAAFYFLLEREFGRLSAAFAAGMLATSAGWLAYSELCLTDLPMAAFFSTAVLLALPFLRNSRTAGPVSIAPPEGRASSSPDWRRTAGPPAIVRNEPNRESRALRFLLIGACLGFGTLAKGLVPLALSLPFFWFLRSYWRSWWLAIVSCLVVAAPWYVAVYARNGYGFIEEFFVRHHFERLYSTSLQHVQPPYYYFPVLLAGLFPWTPLLGMCLSKRFQWDRRTQFLACIALFGFLFFSISLNKLPGYVLPLLPSLIALACSYFAGRPLADVKKAWFLACALLIACIPLVASILPTSLTVGRFTFSALRIDKTAIFYIAAPLATVLLARRSWIMPLLALCVVAGGIYIKVTSYPVLDARVSARGVWRNIRSISSGLCDGGTNRDWIYGLDYYRGAAIPACDGPQFRYMIRSAGHGLPTVTPLPARPTP